MSAVRTITCIGELLVDFISTQPGADLLEATGFTKFAGGAAANVAVGLAKLGVRSAFVGKVGDEPFGKFLSTQLRQYRVDVSGLCFDKEHRTRLAFVALTRSGDRSFEFWERYPADEQLRGSDLNTQQIADADIIHVSSFLLIAEPSRSTMLNLAKKLHRRGCTISFDPNLRLPLWKSRAEAKRVMIRMAQSSTILRLNEEEAQFLTGLRDCGLAARKLLSLGPQLVVVTRGAKGCCVVTERSSMMVGGFRVHAVDTTGCGDGFMAGLLHGVVNIESGVDDLSTDELRPMCMHANAVAALTATKPGVIAALPTSAEVKRFLSRQERSW